MNENLSLEFQQKYMHTFLNISMDKGLTYNPYYIKNVYPHDDPKSKEFLVTLYTLDTAKSLNSVFSHLIIDYKFPRLGFVNVKNTCLLFVDKKSDRQFKKGPCPQTLNFQNLHYVYLNALVRSCPAYGFGSVHQNSDSYTEVMKMEALFKNKFDSVPDALKKLLNSLEVKPPYPSIGLPIDYKWAFTVSPNSKYDVLLFRETLPVGFIKVNQTFSDFTTDIAELYFQEWSDFCRRKGLDDVRIRTL